MPPLTLKDALLFALGVVGVAFTLFWILAERPRRARPPGGRPRRAVSGLQVAIGGFANFFDTLGIGSFATTTSIYKLRGLVADEKIPGTLNVGHMLPTVAQAFIYIVVVEVEARTLALMIGAAVLGAWVGAGAVSRWPRRKVQLGMGLTLLGAAAIIVVRQLGAVPAGADALSLHGARLAMGLTGNFVLGALMTLGIGLYAPCMILVSLLGMNEKTAFPIMMGSCAFLMPVAGVRFIRSGKYDVRAAVGLAVGGVPAVLAAGLIVKSLPLWAVKWLVVAVVIYTAAAMLRSAARERVDVGQGS